ncbi:AraC family transcriptional regulator [Serinibacter arcticus]|uniref:DNA-3-methyladenine glycosylase II n=1 Tax=Serinibacter arcticus TaxID=1655435 RepID=A0A2U1ZUY1_9MICO|nr:Ada metal-binding domain-containing protein [Serinibacter arcticus]PWD50796.1 AraC family transcriptional regulator [Serinibacter arcticus]
MHLPLDAESAHRAVAGRDPRWDGRLYLGVATTGIYCRPSCPARTPLPHHCQYFPTAAAAVAAGFRACKRCRPDALPGTRHWDARGDLVARAVRLIADGALDDGGVAALAQRLAVSERHLHRMLLAEAGASAQQLGRTRRAHVARTLIEQTGMPLSDVAFAAGFGSIRQFNDVMLAEFGASPRSFRRPRGSGVAPSASGTTTADGTSAVDGQVGLGAPSIALRLGYRGTIAALTLRRTLAAHAIGGVERIEIDGGHTRVVDAPSGPAIVRVDLGTEDVLDQPIAATFQLASLTDLMPVMTRVRRWLDLDADPALVAEHLGGDPLLGPLIAVRPGLRVLGAIDGAEVAVCAVLGQQVSVAIARVFQSRIAAAFGAPVVGVQKPLAEMRKPLAGVPQPLAGGQKALADGVHTFPRAEVLAAAGPQAIRDAANLTQARARTVHALATAIAEGLVLEPGVDPEGTRAALLALPGIGPWTADYVNLRALRDPDAFLPGDLVLRKALAAATSTPLKELTPRIAETLAQPWRPWRSYALQHLWTQEVYA